MDLCTLVASLRAGNIWYQVYTGVCGLPRVVFVYAGAIFVWYRHSSGVPMIRVIDDAVGADLTVELRLRCGSDLVDYVRGLRARMYTLPVAQN